MSEAAMEIHRHCYTHGDGDTTDPCSCEARNERDRLRAIIEALRAERFDPFRNEVTLHGVRYSCDLFAHLGVAPVGTWVRIEKREGETLWLRLIRIDDPIDEVEILRGLVAAMSRQIGEVLALADLPLPDPLRSALCSMQEHAESARARGLGREERP